MTQATNNSAMRERNRKLVLETIRRSSASRAEVSRAIGLTRASVTYITDALLREGLIAESATVKSAKGRNPVPLRINPGARNFLGINLMREGIVAGLVNLGGETLIERGFAYTADAPSSQLKAVLDEISASGIAFDSVGVCAPGPLDYQRGVILNPPRFDRWHGFDVSAFVRKQLGCETYLDNVANAAALEEMYFGLGSDLDSFIVLLVISGIGAGVVMNRRLLRGMRGLGNEIGHCSIDYNGIPCECGNRGCLERYAAIPTILEGSRFSSWDEAARDNSAEGRALVEREANYLSSSMIGIVNMLDVDKIILKGSIASSADRVCEIIRENLIRNSIAKYHIDSLRVEAHAQTQPVRAAAMPAINAFYT